MNKKHSTKTLISLMLLAASATFLLTFFVLHQIYGADDELRAEMRRIEEVRTLIAARYVGEYEESALTEAALIATVQALGDRWSHYMTPEQHEAHLRRIGNRQQGIGINFIRHEETGELLIVAVTPGSPAEAAGLLAGEHLVTLQGQPAADLETVEIQQLVTEQYGHYVTVEMRDEAGKLRTVRVYVKEFYVNPVSYELLEENIGYIRIANFDRQSDVETINAIESLREAGAEGLIFDARVNPGGRLDALLALLDYLLPEGEIFVYEDQHGVEHVRHSGPDYLRMPMVVLVDANSFSAAELFAAVLQEYDWAEIVGIPTTGKSRVQLTIPLSTGSGLHLSISRYLTPGRVDLYEAGGVQPDHVVENELGGEDRQLEKALEVLRQLILNP